MKKLLNKTLCYFLGHRGIGEGWWGDGLYGKVRGGAKDGTGRTHYQVGEDCHRCGEYYVMARFHGEAVTGKNLHG